MHAVVEGDGWADVPADRREHGADGKVGGVGDLDDGFNAGMHAMLELKGLAGRWRREPYRSLTGAEMESFAGG